MDEVSGDRLVGLSQEQTDAAIIQAAQAGELEHFWQPLELDDLVLLFTPDALKLDGLRVPMSARVAQLVADELGAMLPTAKLADRMFRASNLRLGPFPRPVSSSLEVARQHDADLEKARAGRQGVVSGWKHWILSPRIAELKAVNYGWLVETGEPYFQGIKLHPSATDPALKAIQPESAVHSLDHRDYSQLTQLVSRRAWLKGREVDLADLLTDPARAKLISRGVMPARYAVELPEDLRPDDTDPEPPSCPRVTSPGERGGDVVKWQSRLVVDGYGSFLSGHGGTDGIHGGATERATVSWFADRGLDRSRSLCEPEAGPLVADEIRAANYTRANRSEVKWCVLHSTENTPAAGVARNVAEWFAGRQGAAPRASAHYCIGNDEAIACVPENDVSWAAPGANRYGINFEIVGRALSSDWITDCDPALQRAALLVARSCRRWNVPTVFVDADGLKRGERGITTHFEVSRAWRKSTHVDPGGPGNKNFPLSWFLEQVRKAI